MQDLFVTTTPFLQPFLIKELQELGIPKIRPGLAGVFVPREMEFVYKINYCSRFATRVLFPFAQFRCESREDLYEGAYELDWPEIFSVDQTFAIDANVTSPTIRHSLFAAQVVKDAICDRFREANKGRPSVQIDSPNVQFNLFIYNGLATLSLDTSGAPLFKRGFRTQAGEAPLQESVAAALIEMNSLSSSDILCDPFCGSGTILIEAAYKLTQTPPGFFRRSWGFFNHPLFSEAAWNKVREEANSKRIPLAPGKLFGADKDPKAVEMCMQNLKNCQFDTQIEVVCKDIRSFFPPTAPTLIISNPPYGKRLQTSAELYQAFGHFMKTRVGKSCHASILCPDEFLIRQSGLTVTRKEPISFGGLDLFLFDLQTQ